MEAHQEQQQMDPYSAQMRNHHGLFSEDSRVAALNSIHARERMSWEYQRLSANEDLTAEAKERDAAAIADRHGPRVTNTALQAKETIEKQAERVYKSSIPKPKGQQLETDDVNRLLLVQGEEQKLRRLLDKKKENRIFKNVGVTDWLRDAYRRGLEEGGVQGATTCAAVLRVAEEENLTADEVVSPFRSQDQWDSADKARRLMAIASDISTTPPNPPKSLQPPRRLSKAPERNRARVSPILMGSSGAPIAKREASHITGASEEAVSDVPEPAGATRTPPAPKKTRKKRAWK